MNKQDDSRNGAGKKPQSSPVPSEGSRKPTGKENNSPQETVGTKTPGVKKDEDLPVAAERKARLDGTKEKTDGRA